MRNELIVPSRKVYIVSEYSCGGKEEMKGPLKDKLNYCCDDDKFGKDTWEKAESEMQKIALYGALSSAELKDTDINILLAGDLTNQCVVSSYGLLSYDIPYVGLYGACSTCALGMGLATCLIGGGMADTVATVSSSHFCSSERQFRYPLEYGGQRPPTSQWTVTGAGAFILGDKGEVCVSEVLFGKSLDMGIKDVNNMGAAMAPAAAQTIRRYFSSSANDPSSFDLIVTGDLGCEGSRILCDLLLMDGIDITKNHTDCGLMIYDIDKQDKHSGGSGCGCSASVMASDIIKRLRTCELNDVLFIGTGALMNTLTLYQGGSIPAIAHLVRLSSGRDKNG